MKLALKILAVIVLLVVLAVAAMLIYVKTALPDVGPPPDISVEITPERLERGEYLVNHVHVCLDCHSERDYSVWSAPIKPGTHGMGGEKFDQKMGLPGSYVASNITPAGIGDWTDGELLRAITTGVTNDGRALFPIMPYNNYSKMSREDLYSVIAYIRTLDPIEHDVSASSSDFPMNFIVNTIPQPVTILEEKPNPSDELAHGQYMINAAGCFICHTREEQGVFVGDPYGGGMEFPMPNGSIVRSPNITPHKENGIGTWTEEMFVQNFKKYIDSTYLPRTVAEGDFQTVMPWTLYANMKEDDLKAIYAFLQTVEPSANKIERYTPSY